MFVSVLFAMFILSACNPSKLSFSEIENVPQKIEEHIDSNLKLQSINDGTKGSYIIFHSNGEIEADLDPQDNIINIIINELNPQDKDIKRNVYYLTTDSKHDTINVLVNGEEIPFDEATIL
ncbi:peptidylprolyl isomerase [Lysinibacillus xylanilyticus]|uniref:Peptidylprolyl isomerase n=1 Tax=Lysinibacillus xylanilyticus TaxID=582475 RepID=A0ABT4EWK5_9BACI|nr:peptidylprolyl isomerase [Lysinibacillus xylanilyticus]MCY9550059.1 peptidylprolyl isomerase [Lysinibacillus xylanilyticus]MED3804933.1 peptidylprolyl isomerase [Lysinibacillus xylanilyticus]